MRVGIHNRKRSHILSPFRQSRLLLLNVILAWLPRRIPRLRSFVSEIPRAPDTRGNDRTDPSRVVSLAIFSALGHASLQPATFRHALLSRSYYIRRFSGKPFIAAKRSPTAARSNSPGVPRESSDPTAQPRRRAPPRPIPS